MSIDIFEDVRLVYKTHYQDLLDEARRERVVLRLNRPRVRLFEGLQRLMTSITEYAQLYPATARAECALNPVQC